MSIGYVLLVGSMFNGLKARSRLIALAADDPRHLSVGPISNQQAVMALDSSDNRNVSRGSMYTASFVCGCFGTIVASLYFSVAAALAFGLPCALLPNALRQRRARRRAEQFSRDYPTILLAMASSLRAGLSIHEALRRAVTLLPTSSLSRTEVELLVRRLQSEMPRELCVRRFAASISVPEAELFRIATLIALEHGGSLGITLERLAKVAAERRALIEAAQVSTASMRMTANTLLGITPFLVVIQLSRTPELVNEILGHPTARGFASLGLVLIFSGYAALYQLSNFKP